MTEAVVLGVVSLLRYVVAAVNTRTDRASLMISL